MSSRKPTEFDTIRITGSRFSVPCNFTLPEGQCIYKRGIMAKEHGGNIVCGCLRPADLRSLCLGVCHARAHTGSYHGKFQLTEYARHLQESLTHRVCRPLAAIQRNTAHNDQQQTLFPNAGRVSRSFSSVRKSTLLQTYKNRTKSLFVKY